MAARGPTQASATCVAESCHQVGCVAKAILKQFPRKRPISVSLALLCVSPKSEKEKKRIRELDRTTLVILLIDITHV